MLQDPNARVHHEVAFNIQGAVCGIAIDYVKRSHVLRVKLVGGSEYLFQARDMVSELCHTYHLSFNQGIQWCTGNCTNCTGLARCHFWHHCTFWQFTLSVKWLHMVQIGYSGCSIPVILEVVFAPPFLDIVVEVESATCAKSCDLG